MAVHTGFDFSAVTDHRVGDVSGYSPCIFQGYGVFVERILEHFHIQQYFDVVVGSELDGTRSKKSEVVQEALNQLFKGGPVQRESVYMIGDTKYDIEGARECGVESIGVAYGYGGLEQLMDAHADYIVCSVEELRNFLRRSLKEKRIPPFVSSSTVFENWMTQGAFPKRKPFPKSSRVMIANRMISSTRLLFFFLKR